MRSSVSIALFFLLSAFFLFALLAALQHSKKALAVAIACLAGVVCIIVFLTPVRLPVWWPFKRNLSTTTTVVGPTTTVRGATTTSLPPGVTAVTLVGRTTTTSQLSGTTTTGAGR